MKRDRVMKIKYPKYEKIKDYVIKGIRSQNFSKAVPSENQLAEKFGVSRMTARKAIDAVEREGLVERIPGKGTFVKKKLHYTTGFFRVRPFQKWADDLNVELSAKVLEAQVIDPPAHVSKSFKTNGQVIIIRRLWYFDQKPVRYEIRYLRPDVCAGILWEDLKNESIHNILINKYKLSLTKISQSMEAIVLTKETAPLFNVKPGYPAFYFKRMVYSFDDPITYVEYYMRGEMAFRDTFSPQFDPSDFLNLPDPEDIAL
jgi:GntR family transcriptional regulator